MKKLLYIYVLLTLMSACGNKKDIVVVNSNSNKQVVSKYAKKLQVSQSKITNIVLYEFIDDWYGTEYRYGGVSKAGVDCSGFCNVLYNKVYQKQLPRSTKDIVKTINKVSQDKLQEGDLVFFNISGKKNSHVGLYLVNNYFVHASTSKGVIISSLTNPYYKKAYSKGGSV
ncbi:MAG: NlpC/P60 family protein [Vicingaceae bacterium]|nr:NlpC/P60 family protein [Vicingaceae bacterium]